MQKYTIGFTNLSEDADFSIAVRESLEAAVAAYPNLSLVCLDNRMDDECALQNAQTLADMDVDLAIIYHINERIGPKLRNILNSKAIPIISVDIPIQFTSYFGVNNQEAGRLAGQELVQWVQTHWDGQVDKVLAMVESRVLDAVRGRVEQAVKVLSEHVAFSANDVLYIDSGNVHDLTLARVIPVLERWSSLQHIVVLGFNEESTLGALEAITLVGREDRVIVVGQGATKNGLQRLADANSPLLATTLYSPDAYGQHLVELAQRLFAGERIPAKNYVDLNIYTREMVARA